MRTLWLAMFTGLALAVGGALAHETRQFALPSGATIQYVLVLPDKYDPATKYEGLLAFPGGDQTLSRAISTVERFWEREAKKRGVIVVVPVAPSLGRPFYIGEGSLILVPDIIAAMRATFPIMDGPMHIGGHSNGGVTAFRTAIRWPEEFSSLTVIAGIPAEQDDFSRIDRLKGMKISMFVGSTDFDWRGVMAEVHTALTDLGIPATFTIVPRSGHVLEAMSYEKSGAVFDTVVPAPAGN